MEQQLPLQQDDSAISVALNPARPAAKRPRAPSTGDAVALPPISTTAPSPPIIPANDTHPGPISLPPIRSLVVSLPERPTAEVSAIDWSGIENIPPLFSSFGDTPDPLDTMVRTRTVNRSPIAASIYASTPVGSSWSFSASPSISLYPSVSPGPSSYSSSREGLSPPYYFSSGGTTLASASVSRNSTPATDGNAEQYDDNDLAEHQAAVEQAGEQGSIVVDGDELNSDTGYESDNATSASTSLAESMRDYIFENGRRYHRFREGRYNFPNDDVEQQREDMKHAMVKMLCGNQLCFAPIGKNPQEILDIGTGTGIWAIEMGDQFPSANVLGIDLSPIQPEWVPPNVRFMVDDVESPWLHPRDHFDFIHSRHTVMAIKNWPRLMRRSLEHLRPGGWLELHEVYHYPISLNGSMGPNHPVTQYWRLINEGLRNLGIQFHTVAGQQMKNMMIENGYVNVEEKVLHIPIGTWPKNKVLKAVGLYWRTILLDGIQAIALGPLTRGCGWSREEVELFLIQVRRAYLDNSCLAYMPLHIILGQKPMGCGKGTEGAASASAA